MRKPEKHAKAIKKLEEMGFSPLVSDYKNGYIGVLTVDVPGSIFYLDYDFVDLLYRVFKREKVTEQIAC